mgnify:CR=1 FL=1|tara:strand:- start:298 stop:1512 length:1215 start_codon:yes stop_codon:yes gene_type:complete
MLLKRTKPYLIILILMALAVSPAFALGEGNRNLLLIGAMGLMPIIILYFGRFDRINPWLGVFMLSVIIIPLIHQPQSMRWSTVLYSVMFCLTFMAYQELLHRSYFTPKHYLKLLKYLILAYFVVLVIQQFCVLTGLPVFNLSNYNPTEPWKLNALAAEPSHSARIVGLLMYCYITIKELVINRKYNFKIDIKKDKWVWIAFIWTMVTMVSGTAFLFIVIVLLKFIRFKNLIPVFILAGTIFILVNYFEITSFERTYKTVIATLTLDESTIIEADHSASVRIVPFIILGKMISLNSWDGWFGHGIDHVGTFLSDALLGVPEGISGGGMFQVWIEYGFISFVLFVVFSLFTTYRKGDYISIVFWFMLVFLYGVNSQIVWLCIILLFTNKYFFKRTSIKNKLQNGNS